MIKEHQMLGAHTDTFMLYRLQPMGEQELFNIYYSTLKAWWGRIVALLGKHSKGEFHYFYCELQAFSSPKMYTFLCLMFTREQQ